MRDRTPDQRLLKGAPATLRVTFADQDGEPDASIDSGVTVTVTRLDGTVLATAQAATTTADGEATYALTAAQTGAGLDVLTVEWTHDSVVRATTYAEIVGRHWFPASALREISGVADAQATPPGDATDQALIDARTRTESMIERFVGAAYVPRAERETLTGRGDTQVWLSWWYPRTLRALTIDEVAEDLDDWQITRYGTLARVDGGTITSLLDGIDVQYDHGLDQPPPDLVRDAKIAAAQDLLERASTVSSRLTGQSFASGTVSYATVDEEHPTGLPNVDATIRRERDRHLRAGV